MQLQAALPAKGQTLQINFSLLKWNVRWQHGNLLLNMPWGFQDHYHNHPMLLSSPPQHHLYSYIVWAIATNVFNDIFVSGTTLLVSFSLTRNWYRLIGDSNDEVARDLRAINAIRFLFMYGIVLAHVGVFTNVSPTTNPQFMENVCMLGRLVTPHVYAIFVVFDQFIFFFLFLTFYSHFSNTMAYGRCWSSMVQMFCKYILALRVIYCPFSLWRYARRLNSICLFCGSRLFTDIWGNKIWECGGCPCPRCIRWAYRWATVEPSFHELCTNCM